MNRLCRYVDRPASVITGAPVEILHTLRDFPVFFGCVDTPIEDDLFADLVWGIDPKCGAIQLTKLIPLEILYQEQHADALGSTWDRYNEEFSLFVLASKSQKVLEIGGGSGKLAKIITDLDSSIEWSLVEPNPIIKNGSRIIVFKDFFDSQFDLNSEIDTIVFSQVLEHAYDPKEFISNIYRLLPTGGKVVFAYPQLTSWLSKMFTNAVNFEHSILIDDFIEYLFVSQGFTLDRRIDYGDHSVFYAFEKISVPFSVDLPVSKYAYYKSLYLDFVSYHESLVEDLNSRIAKSKVPVYLFGAHIFATHLFALGLNPQISGILDNSSLKHGRRLYGTVHFAQSPQILKGMGTVNVILKAGFYNDEIRQDILENINPNVVFW